MKHTFGQIRYFVKNRKIGPAYQYFPSNFEKVSIFSVNSV